MRRELEGMTRVCARALEGFGCGWILGVCEKERRTIHSKGPMRFGALNVVAGTVRIVFVVELPVPAFPCVAEMTGPLMLVAYVRDWGDGGT